MRALVLLLCLYTSNTFGAMLDVDGLPRTEQYTIPEVTRHCDAKGYFIYGGTIYMCVKIREHVSKEELRAYTKADNIIQAKKRKEQLEWYKEYLKTDEGKAWKKKWDKEYDEKLKAKGKDE